MEAGQHITTRETTEAVEIRAAGLKATETRIKIYRLFRVHEVGHFSAEDIYRHFMGKGKEISIATIYRVLAHFEETNLLTRRQFKRNIAVYELTKEQHDHLICNQCGCVFDFSDHSIERLQNTIAEKYGFRVADHSLTLYVDCARPNCRGRGPKID